LFLSPARQVFTHLGESDWPRIGVCFATAGEKVRIIAPPEGQRFRPLLPTATGARASS
jgi:hypothetical protein